MEVARSVGKSCNHLGTFSAFSTYYAQIDFFDRECAFPENDSSFEMVSFDKVFRTK